MPPGEELGPGQIHDSNSYALTAAARDAGAIAYRVGTVAGRRGRCCATVVEDQLSRADLLVTTGGVSVGAYDVVKEALASGGPEVRRAARRLPQARHAARQAAGLRRASAPSIPLLALPGNPVCSYVSFELFVRPAIRTLMGAARRPPADGPGAAAADRRSLARGPAPVPARQVRRAARSRPVGGQGSHLIAALAHADALIVVPEDVTEVAAGAEVDVVLLA